MKFYHYILPSIVILVCLLLALCYGYNLYESLAGHDFTSYHYLRNTHVSRKQYDFYCYSVAVIALRIVARLLKAILKKDVRKMYRILLYFLFFFAILVCCEAYLESIRDPYKFM